ncbi:MAG: nuclear transport factor 2 family protein [Phycisphaerales bacterium]
MKRALIVAACGPGLVAVGGAAFQPTTPTTNLGSADLNAVQLAERDVVGLVLLADRAPSIDAVLDDFHDAAAKADFDRYFSHWTSTSVFLGTDSWERWTGDEFKEFARPHFDKGKGWTYTSRDRKVTLTADKTVAWFDEMLTNEKLGTCRGSGVLLKIGEDWKIAQYNLSVPIPNDIVEDVAKRIGEHRRAK